MSPASSQSKTEPAFYSRMFDSYFLFAASNTILYSSGTIFYQAQFLRPILPVFNKWSDCINIIILWLLAVICDYYYYSYLTSDVLWPHLSTTEVQQKAAGGLYLQEHIYERTALISSYITAFPWSLIFKMHSSLDFKKVVTWLRLKATA